MPAVLPPLLEPFREWSLGKNSPNLLSLFVQEVACLDQVRFWEPFQPAMIMERWIEMSFMVNVMRMPPSLHLGFRLHCGLMRYWSATWINWFQCGSVEDMTIEMWKRCSQTVQSTKITRESLISDGVRSHRPDSVVSALNSWRFHFPNEFTFQVANLCNRCYLSQASRLIWPYL